MITLFSVPKPFRGNMAIIQRNAVRSWLQIRLATEIFLMGDDEGTAGMAREFGLRHLPDVACNEYGTPLLSSLFELAQAAAGRCLLAYINADIMLHGLDGAVPTAAARFERFLLIGQRWDLGTVPAVDFSPGWHLRLRAQANLRAPDAVDWLVFTPGIWSDIPPFALGRYAWDNWLVDEALRSGVPVVDATPVVTALHQPHEQRPRQGPEWQRNLELHGRKGVGKVSDATWALDEKGLRLK